MEKQLKEESMKCWLQKGLLAMGIFILAFVFSLRCSTHIWNVGVSGTDSSVFQYVARVILDGGMPYRDTFDHKGPLLYLINVAGLVISRWRGIWIIELAVLFVTFFLIYRIARLKCNVLSSFVVLFCSLIPLFSYFEGGNFTEEYAMPFIAAALWVFADYFLNGRINRRRLILCGFSFGAVCLLRINMVVIWAVMCIAVLVLCLLKRQFKQLGFFLCYFSLGIAIIAVPIMLWLMANGAFFAFIEDYFVFNFAYAADAESAKLTKKTEVLVYFLGNRIVLMALVISIYLAVKKRDAFHYTYVVFMLGSLMVAAMSGRMYPHYAMILLPALVYPFAYAASLIQIEIRNEKGTALLITAFLLVSEVLPVWIGAFQDVVWMSAKPRETYLNSTEVMARDVIDGYSEKEDPIIVYGNWNALYNLSNRFAASEYSFQDPIGKVSPEIMKDFFDDLEENKPKVFVMDNRCFDRERGLEFIEKNAYECVWQSSDGMVDVYVLNPSEMETGV